MRAKGQLAATRSVTWVYTDDIVLIVLIVVIVVVVGIAVIVVIIVIVFIVVFIIATVVLAVMFAILFSVVIVAITAVVVIASAEKHSIDDIHIMTVQWRQCGSSKTTNCSEHQTNIKQLKKTTTTNNNQHKIKHRTRKNECFC